MAIDNLKPKYYFHDKQRNTFEIIDTILGLGINHDELSPSKPALVSLTKNAPDEFFVQYASRMAQKNYNVNTVDIDGITPLMAAAASCSPIKVKWLLQNGADRSVKNNNGKTALELSEDISSNAPRDVRDGCMTSLRLLNEESNNNSNLAGQFPTKANTAFQESIDFPYTGKFHGRVYSKIEGATMFETLFIKFEKNGHMTLLRNIDPQEDVRIDVTLKKKDNLYFGKSTISVPKRLLFIPTSTSKLDATIVIGESQNNPMGLLIGGYDTQEGQAVFYFCPVKQDGLASDDCMHWPTK